MSHNVVERYRKRLVPYFGRAQCAMAFCFLAQKLFIYIAYDASAIVPQVNLGSAFSNFNLSIFELSSAVEDSLLLALSLCTAAFGAGV